MTGSFAVQRMLWFQLAGAFTAFCLTACASAAMPAADVPGVRLIVKLVRPSEDPLAVAAEAGRVAGVPVRYAAAVSPAWHAILLTCASPAECAAATERLRQAHDRYEAVEIDGRQQAR